MKYTSTYDSKLGKIILVADEIGLTGLWFEGQKHFIYDNSLLEIEIPIFENVKHWLDIYFSGEKPSFTPPIHLIGTKFQTLVWEILKKIPYGETTTYGEIAKQICHNLGLKKMSAQAVGGAVSRNKISIIVPCHRVIGSNKSLIGYAGGLDRKIKLLTIEKNITSNDNIF